MFDKARRTPVAQATFRDYEFLGRDLWNKSALDSNHPTISDSCRDESWDRHQTSECLHAFFPTEMTPRLEAMVEAIAIRGQSAGPTSGHHPGNASVHPTPDTNGMRDNSTTHTLTGEPCMLEQKATSSSWPYY